MFSSFYISWVGCIAHDLSEYTILGDITRVEKLKIHKHSLKYIIFGEEFNNSSYTEVFRKDFVDNSFENALFLILEDSICLQLIYFVFVKCLLSVDGDALN